MISAGFIGGGEPPAPLPGAATPFFEGTGAPPEVWGNFKMQEAFDATLGLEKSKLNQGYWQMGANFFTSMVNNIFGYAMQSRWLSAQETIDGRRAEAMENISADGNETQRKWIDFMGEADERMNERGGLRERLAEIESNRDIAMYDRRMDSQERIAAMRGLDNAFSVRSEYNYGNPYA